MSEVHHFGLRNICFPDDIVLLSKLPSDKMYICLISSTNFVISPKSNNGLFVFSDDVGMEIEAYQRAKALPGRVVDLPQLGPRPFFDDVSARNVTAIVGQSAVLHCRVKNLGQRTVRSCY